jgi:hypothetical protein
VGAGRRAAQGRGRVSAAGRARSTPLALHTTQHSAGGTHPPGTQPARTL